MTGDAGGAQREEVRWTALLPGDGALATRELEATAALGTFIVHRIYGKVKLVGQPTPEGYATSRVC